MLTQSPISSIRVSLQDVISTFECLRSCLVVRSVCLVIKAKSRCPAINWSVCLGLKAKSRCPAVNLFTLSCSLQFYSYVRLRELREDNDGVTAIVISRKHSCKKSKRACPARIMFLSHLICRVKGYCSFRL